MLLSVGGAGPETCFHAASGLVACPVPEAALLGAALEPGTASLAGATVPLSGAPALSSLPGAAKSLYLDFDGDYQPNWDGYTTVSTPAFDADGDPTSFSDAELVTIRKVWE